jgi:hypothetical protein
MISVYDSIGRSIGKFQNSNEKKGKNWQGIALERCGQACFVHVERLLESTEQLKQLALDEASQEAVKYCLNQRNCEVI